MSWDRSMKNIVSLVILFWMYGCQTSVPDSRDASIEIVKKKKPIVGQVIQLEILESPRYEFGGPVVSVKRVKKGTFNIKISRCNDSNEDASISKKITDEELEVNFSEMSRLLFSKATDKNLDQLDSDEDNTACWKIKGSMYKKTKVINDCFPGEYDRLYTLFCEIAKRFECSLP